MSYERKDSNRDKERSKGAAYFSPALSKICCVSLGKILDNSKNIDEYGLQNDNTIILVKKVNQQEKKNR